MNFGSLECFSALRAGAAAQRAARFFANFSGFGCVVSPLFVPIEV